MGVWIDPDSETQGVIRDTLATFFSQFTDQDYHAADYLQRVLDKAGFEIVPVPPHDEAA